MGTTLPQTVIYATIRWSGDEREHRRKPGCRKLLDFEHTHEGGVRIGASRIGDSAPSGAIIFANVVLEVGRTYATRWVRNSPDPDNQHILQGMAIADGTIYYEMNSNI